MAKINIVNAFTWLCNTFDTQNLSMAEQNLMLHLLKFLNRNFWKPLKITNRRLADSMHSDQHRTVKPTLEKLIKKGLITRDEEGRLYIGIEGTKKPAKSSGKQISAEDIRNIDDEHEQPSESKPGNIRSLKDYITN